MATEHCIQMSQHPWFLNTMVPVARTARTDRKWSNTMSIFADTNGSKVMVGNTCQGFFIKLEANVTNASFSYPDKQ